MTPKLMGVGKQSDKFCLRLALDSALEFAEQSNLPPKIIWRKRLHAHKLPSGYCCAFLSTDPNLREACAWVAPRMHVAGLLLW